MANCYGKTITFCTGIGGVDTGFVAANLSAWGGFEFDPAKPQLSQQKKDIYDVNFASDGAKLHLITLQQAAANGWLGVPRNPLILHGSQPCDDFSAINTKGKETRLSLGIATAMADGLRSLSPEFFTLENVPGFLKSKSFQIICNALKELGYKFHYKIIPLLGYQNRQRLILLAGQNQPLQFPPSPRPQGWWDVVKPFRRQFKLCDWSDRLLASAKVQAAIKGYNCPLLIERIYPKFRQPHVRLQWEPCWGITDVFSDGKGGGRTNAFNVWLDGELWALPINAIAALQGFPSWYQFSPNWAVSGSGIALSVPPEFMTSLVQHNSKILRQSSYFNIQIR